jgi:ribosomal protein S12 methylthiotransferase accessory factor
VREQDKVRPPQETVDWAKRRFASLAGEVLRQTLRIDSGRLGIPVYLSLCGDRASVLTGTKKQMGKGASPAQAEASALMELAERFSFFSFIKTTPFPLLKAEEVPGPSLDFALAARAVQHPPSEMETGRQIFNLLPQTWAWARNLTREREEMIPLGWFYAINEYNGPAAGNCQEEAVLQSLCEVVERHVCALVTLEKRTTPGIDPASVRDPVARELLDKFAQVGIKVFIKDFTCEMGIPSVAALCYDPSTFPQDSEIVYAAGTATSPAKALIRALTEVAQLAGDFNQRTAYLVSALPKFETLDQAGYVMESAGTVPLDALPDLSNPDLLEEIKTCVQALRQRGYEVYTLDISHPELKIPAVYTLIPGAHFAQRTTGTDVVFHTAKLASQLENPELALKVLGQMSQVAVESYFLPFFSALALLNCERPDEALELLDRALEMNPPSQDEASIHTQRGVALKDLGRYEQAKKALLKAAAFPEPHHEVFNLLGFCHYMQKEHEQAIECFSRAIEIEPGEAINYANIGSNLRELGRIEEACSMYEHALEMDPGLDFARENLRRLRGEDG